MSGAVFLVGLSFLGIAAVTAVSQPDGATTTAVVGGIGVVQIVALFYRNPLRDIQAAVSNAQQAKIAIMSYILVVSLVGESVYEGKDTDSQNRRLSELTDKALHQLEHFTEDQTINRHQPDNSFTDAEESDGDDSVNDTGQ